MPYHLIPGEPIPAGIRRVVREEIEWAARQLSGANGRVSAPAYRAGAGSRRRGPRTVLPAFLKSQESAGRDTAIHEARKSMKKIRGALRLMRPEVDPVYREENAWFRDVGLRLAGFRDAGAMIETFDALRRKYRGEPGRRTMASIRRGLVARKRHAEARADIGQVLGAMGDALSRRALRAERWPLETGGFAALAPGLEATFRGGRKALERVRKHPSPENYHEWRKRVKDHWYHVRLLEKYWTGAMQAYEKSLKDLETWLGEDHNLVVLRETVLAEPELFGSAPDIAFFVKLTGRYHKELRANAVALGRHIYGEKPRQFIQRLRRLWEASDAQRRLSRRPTKTAEATSSASTP